MAVDEAREDHIIDIEPSLTSVEKNGVYAGIHGFWKI